MLQVGETEAQISDIVISKSHTKYVAEPGLNLNSRSYAWGQDLTPEPGALCHGTLMNVRV